MRQWSEGRAELSCRLVQVGSGRARQPEARVRRGGAGQRLARAGFARSQYARPRRPQDAALKPSYAQLHRRAEQVLDLEAEADVKRVGEPLAVAMGRVALVAQQAERPARSCERSFGERCEFIELVLRLGRREMALEDAQHCIRVSTARGEPAFFRSAELLQMHIADTVLIEPSRELAFRKPRPARRRHSADIDQ